MKNTLLPRKIIEPGSYKLLRQGKNDGGKYLQSGIYVVRMSSENKIKTENLH